MGEVRSRLNEAGLVDLAQDHGQEAPGVMDLVRAREANHNKKCRWTTKRSKLLMNKTKR